MKLTFLGIVATCSVIFLGIFMIIPPYLQAESSSLPVLLSFSIVTDSNLPGWCEDLSELIHQQKVSGILFISGENAKLNPYCVSEMSDEIEIGSQSFHYTDISNISDYSLQLHEVKSGKNTIDKIGEFDSKAFKAPHGKTDQNIYSILERSGIAVDFSPKNQYNIFHEGQFIKFEVVTIDVDENTIFNITDNLRNENKFPLILNVDNNISVSKINDLISELKKSDVRFETASDFVNYKLWVNQ